MYDPTVIADRMSGDDAYVAAMLNRGFFGLVSGRRPTDLLRFALSSDLVTPDGLDNVIADGFDSAYGDPDAYLSEYCAILRDFLRQPPTPRHEQVRAVVISALLELAVEEDIKGTAEGAGILDDACAALLTIPPTHPDAVAVICDNNFRDFTGVSGEAIERLAEYAITVVSHLWRNTDMDDGLMVCCELISAADSEPLLLKFMDILHTVKKMSREDIFELNRMDDLITKIVGTDGRLAYEYLQYDEWSDWTVNTVFRSHHYDRLEALFRLIMADSDIDDHDRLTAVRAFLSNSDTAVVMDTFEAEIAAIVEKFTAGNGTFSLYDQYTVVEILDRVIANGSIGWLAWAWNNTPDGSHTSTPSGVPLEVMIYNSLRDRITAGELDDPEVAEELLTMVMDPSPRVVTSARAGMLKAIMESRVLPAGRVEQLRESADAAVRNAATAAAPVAKRTVRKGDLLDERGFPVRASSFEAYVHQCEQAGLTPLAALGLFAVDTRFARDERDHARDALMGILSDCPEYADGIPDRVWSGMNRIRSGQEVSMELCNRLMGLGPAATRFASRNLIKATGLLAS